MGIQIVFILLFALNLALPFIWPKQKWPWLISLPLKLIIPLLMVFPAQPRFELDYYWWYVAGYIAMVLGAGVALIAAAELGRHGVKWYDAEPGELVKTGFYRYLRHPIYLGFIFFLVGWWWVWAAVYGFYFGMIILAQIWIQAHLEEKFILEKKFGGSYLEYRKNTGMFWIK